MVNSYVNVVIAPLPRPLTYSLAPEAATRVNVGDLIDVPLGKKHRTGYVVSKYELAKDKQKFEFEIKAITDARGAVRCFHESQLPFFEWVAEFHNESLVNVIETAVPAVSSARPERLLTLASANPEKTRSPAQNKIINRLADAPKGLTLSELRRDFVKALPALRSLERKGLIKVTELEPIINSPDLGQAPEWAKTSVNLTDSQQRALNPINRAISEQRFESFLLHGVTGSGKTEVYLEAIQKVLALGKTALVLVPEIALTPQLLDRFHARLGPELTVLHSGLSRKERWQAWQSLLYGKARIAIGVRSAIFAPLPNLGLIVVDEEHDTSFKQSEGMRYHARDLAVMRAKLVSCPVILGSATPSLETYHHARAGKYTLLSLKSRPQALTPVTIEIVDLTQIKPWHMASRHVSGKLKTALEITLSEGNQAFILYNRRGFATYLQCDSCDQVIGCPNCSVTLTYHRAEHLLRCHYCNLGIPVPIVCSSCGAVETKERGPHHGAFAERGAGTEKIFDELKVAFPDVSIDRLDRDAVNDMASYRRILDKIRSGETQLLVGTQMIAKGHDLPNVTLVGVVDCDVGLHLPDFRASERVFQLLTQAAGRAGRSTSPGRVLLQTRVPKHPSLVHTLTGNFEAFANGELKARSSLGYPPFSNLLRIVSSSEDPDKARQLLLAMVSSLKSRLPELFHDLKILGPAPAPIIKIKRLYRFHLLCKSPKLGKLREVVAALKHEFMSKNQAVRIIFDLNPQEML